jgi:hypothetical protein
MSQGSAGNIPESRFSATKPAYTWLYEALRADGQSAPAVDVCCRAVAAIPDSAEHLTILAMH